MNRIPRYAALAASLLVLTACAGQRAFHKEVKEIGTPKAYAKGVLDEHNVIGNQIVALKNDPGLSPASKTFLVNLYRKSVCSDQELSERLETASCDEGPSYVADSAIRAYEQLQSATTEAEMQEAADALALIVADLLTAISNAR